MSGPEVRLGVVGCGRLAEQGYLPAAHRVPGVRIVAVADPDPDRRRLLAAGASDGAAPVAAHADALALLAAGAVDALVLATPADRHVGDAEAAVAAGVHVLVEKPPAPDAAGARALAVLGELVHVGFNRRFDPAIAPVRAAMPAAGSVGLRLSISYRRASWQAVAVRDEVLLDLAPHLLDLSRWITGGELRSIAARELTPDRATLDLALTRGTAEITVAADRLHEERVELRRGGRTLARHRTGGPLGAVTGRVGGLVARARGEERPHPLTATLAGQLDALARAVRGAPADTLGTGVDGLAVMLAVDAARASAAAGGAPTPVPDLQEHPSC